METNDQEAQAARTALFQDISDLIAQQTGLELSNEAIETILGEVQREELKRLVYQAFIAVQQMRQAASSASGEEKPKE